MKNQLEFQHIYSKQLIKFLFVLGFLFSIGTVFGQEVVINKVAVENPTTCNQFDVTLSITGDPPNQPQEVVLVIDRSPSMAFVIPGDPQLPIYYAREAAKDFVTELFNQNPTGNNRVAIVTYSQSSTTVFNLSNSSDEAAILAAIDLITTIGSSGTNTEAGIVRADDILTAQGTFDCSVSRSIILMTDGVPTYRIANNTGGGCSTTTLDTSCQIDGIRAVTDAATTTVSGIDYDQNIFSIGLTGGLPANQLPIATDFLNQAHNSGVYFTNNNADLSGIYLDILGQLVAAATQLSTLPLVSDIIPTGFDFVEFITDANPNPTRGTSTYDLPSRTISWDLEEVFNETLTLRYTIEAVSTDVCGISTGIEETRIDYQNSSCATDFAIFTNPETCVPCPAITPSISRVGCTNSVDYTSGVDQGGCTPTGNNYSWVFTLDGTQVGTSNTLSGTFNYTGGDLEGNFVGELSYSGTYGNTTCSIPAISETITIIVDPVLEATITTLSDADCFGTTTGSIDLTVSGGSGDYTYDWDNGATTQDLTNIAAGTYNVVISDVNGCQFTFAQAIIIDEPASVVTGSAAVASEISCFGLTDGSITITFAGGTSPYSITSDIGGFSETGVLAGNQTHSGLAAGAYIYTITDANGCTETATATISAAPSDVSASAAVASEISCFGLTDGSITITFAGGTSPYDISGDFTATDVTAAQTHSGLAANTYNYTITDANGCTETATATIAAAPSDVTASAVVASEISCFGLTDGSITISFAGGTSPYDISGDFTATDVTAAQTHSGLTAGAYIYTITDANGCTETATATISAAPTVIGVTIGANMNNVVCFGDTTGELTATATGGTVGGPSDYTYSWDTNPVQTTAIISDLGVGTYTVTATDLNGCEAMESFTITGSTAALTTGASFTNETCNNCDDGTLSATPTGGTPDYSYVWDLISLESDGSSQLAIYNTQNVSNVPPGTYRVTVTDSLGCTATDSVVVDPFNCNTAVVIDSVTPTDVDCKGNSTGSAVASVTASFAPLTYFWTNSSSTQVGTDSATLSGVPAGVYTVLVTDSKGCFSEANVTIDEPTDVLIANASTTIQQLTLNGTQGTVTATPTGGTGPYTYSWANATAPGTEISTDQTVSGLLPGDYIVTVTDFRGCSATSTTTINAINCNITLSGDFTEILCNGQTSTATATIVGGTAPYTYTWRDSVNTVIQTTTSTNSLTDDLAGLSAGVYSVSVIDAQQCPTTTTITIVEPTALSLGIAVNPVACKGDATGSIDLTVSGGTLDYSYAWTRNGTPIANTSQDLNNLLIGTYEVTVTDSKGCTEMISRIVTEPAEVVGVNIGANMNNVVCFGDTTGELTATATGGTVGDPSDYTYSWDTNPVQTTAMISDLGVGTYTVTATDLNGCEAMESFTITGSTAALTTGASFTNETCNNCDDGTLSATPTGGTPDYSYVWDLISLESDGSSQLAIYNTQNVSNVPPGTYRVTVTDSLGCTATDSVVVDPFNCNTAVVIDSVTPTDVDCKGNSTGSAVASVTASFAPLTYFWTNSSSTQVGTDSATLSGVPAGVYTVLVTDSKGCFSEANVTIDEPTDVLIANASTTIQQLTLNGTQGTVTATPTGGTGPYTYSWANATAPGTEISTDQTVSGLLPGDYIVTVTDFRGCSATSTTTINAINCNITLSGDFTEILCNGQTSTATATIVGGTAPYTYTWRDSVNTVIQTTTSTNSLTDDLAGLSAGVYSVSVIDAQQCPTTTTITIVEPTALSLGIAVNPVACKGDATGSIDLTVSGGTLDYSYAWTRNGTPIANTSQDLNNLLIGTYEVTVTDSKGCTEMISRIVTEPAEVVGVNIGANMNNVVCFGDTTGELTATATGGTVGDPSDYTYSWDTNPVQTTAMISDLGVGTYTVTATDLNGCEAMESFTITGSTAALTTGASFTNETCNNCDDGTLSATPTGGTPDYSYVWDLISLESDGSSQLAIYNTQNVSNVPPGTYRVTVTDSLGCTATDSVVVDPFNCNTAVVIDSVTPTDVDCKGNSTGSAVASVTASFAPLTYFWTNSSSTQVGTDSATLSGVPAGVYTVLVTDSKGCFSEANVTIDEPTDVLIANASTTIQQLTLNGTQGTVTATPTGGTGPYTYSWANATAPGTEISTDQTVSGLLPGDYIVTVTDFRGCPATSTTTINAINCNITLSGDFTEILCNGQTSTATATIVGGTAPYTYTWRDSVNTVIQTTTSTNSLTDDLAGLSAGVYSVSVIDAQQCPTTTTITIVEPTALSLGIAVNPVACKGDATGSIDLTVSGGTLDYSYAWTRNGTPIANTSQDLNNLLIGTYEVTVTDSKGCTEMISRIVTEPAEVVGVNIGANMNNVVCFGDTTGELTATATGGTVGDPSDYTYSWDTNPVQTTAMISDLGVGTYTVTATDLNGCEAMESFTITGSTEVLAASIVSQTNVNCLGGANGEVEVVGNGGMPQYTYHINGDISTQNDTGIFSDLIHGSHIVTVTDAFGCRINHEVIITQPSTVLNLAAEDSDIINDCTIDGSGSVTLTATGGQAPYQYNIDGGTLQDSPLFEGLSAGTYTFEVIDTLECSATVEVTIEAPSAILNLAAEDSDIINDCTIDGSGSVTLTATEGQAPYQYNVDGGTLQDSPLFEGLSAGTYTFEVIDALECSATVEVTIEAPSAILNLAAEDSDIINDCTTAGSGSVTLTATEGSAPYQYNINSGTLQDSPLFEGLSAGTYTFEVIDALECSATVEVTIEAPSAILNLAAEDSDIINDCTIDGSGSVTLTATEGSAPYQYNINSGTLQDSPLFEGLSAGTYTFEVIDALECSATVEVTIEAPSAILNLAAEDSDIINDCTIDGSGSVTLTATEGSAPYQYNINSGTLQDSPLFEGLSAETYLFEVIDALGCSATVEVTIEAPINVLNLAADASDIINDCTVDGSGSVTLTATEGSAPYQYNINGGTLQDSPLFEGLFAETYMFEVIDALGCSATVELTIESPTVDLNVEEDFEICIEDAPIDLFDSLDSSLPLDGVWNVVSGNVTITDGIFDPIIVELGVYVLEYEVDVLGCTSITTITITVNDDCVPCSIDDLYISRVVTPNGDEKNEVFKVGFFREDGSDRTALCGFTYDVKILNRWGHMVFESGNYRNNWRGNNFGGGMTVGSGEKLPRGSYYYVVNVVGSGYKPITGYIYLGSN